MTAAPGTAGGAQEAATPGQALPPLPEKWAKGGGEALHREWWRAQNPRFTDAATGTIWLQLRPEERAAWDALAAENERLRAALREIRERCDQVTLTYEERVRFIREDAEYALEARDA